MRRLALALDGLEDVLSGLLAFLASAMVLLVFAVVVLRYGFGLGSVALQELAQRLHAAIFLLAASIACALWPPRAGGFVLREAR